MKWSTSISAEHNHEVMSSVRKGRLCTNTTVVRRTPTTEWVNESASAESSRDADKYKREKLSETTLTRVASGGITKSHGEIANGRPDVALL